VTYSSAWPPPPLEGFAIFGPRLDDVTTRIPVVGHEGGQESDDGSVAERETMSVWAIFASGVAHVVIAAILWALLWATLPRMFGWQPTVITGHSMSPTIALGDIVLTRPVTAEGLVPGAVITFEDPNHPGRLVTHRIIEIQPDGMVRTRGDNNQSADTQLVSPGAVQGRAVLRIPSLGLPLVWAQTGAFGILILSLGILALLLWLVVRFPL